MSLKVVYSELFYLVLVEWSESRLVSAELHVETVNRHLQPIILIHQLLSLLPQTQQLRAFTYTHTHNCT